MCTHRGWTFPSSPPQFAVGVVIAPIRLFLVAFTLCFGLFIGLTFLAGVSDAALQQRLKPRVRRLIYFLIRIFSRAILFIVGLYKIEEHRLADEAAELVDLNGAPFLLVSNHVSFLDITYHFARDAVAFVAKVEVRRLPIIGRIAAVAQCIFTSRAYVPPSLGGSPVEVRSSPREVGRPGAKSADAGGRGGGSPARGGLSSDGGSEHAGGASAKIGSRLQQRGFPTTLLFPEGTTSNNCALLRFRTGAFIHGAPVKPVLLQWYVLAALPGGLNALLVGFVELLVYLRELERGIYCLLNGHVADTSACDFCCRSHSHRVHVQSCACTCPRAIGRAGSQGCLRCGPSVREHFQDRSPPAALRTPPVPARDAAAPVPPVGSGKGGPAALCRERAAADGAAAAGAAGAVFARRPAAETNVIGAGQLC